MEDTQDNFNKISEVIKVRVPSTVSLLLNIFEGRVPFTVSLLLIYLRQEFLPLSLFS